jgi:hypothetical protein
MSRPKTAITAKSAPMTTKAVARIYKAASHKGSGQVPAGGFEARAARAAAQNQRALKHK